MHAGIDALMHPHFWSLLPSRVFERVIVAASVRDASTPLDTLLHPVSVTSFALLATFTGLSSFQLAPVSTVPDVVGLHHQKHTVARVTCCHSCTAYITYIFTVTTSHISTITSVSMCLLHLNKIKLLCFICINLVHYILLQNMDYTGTKKRKSMKLMLCYHGVCLPSQASSLSTNWGTLQFTDGSQLG